MAASSFSWPASCLACATAAFFTAGSFKVAYWRFLLWDGSAALISVPIIMGLAYYFSDRIKQVEKWVENGQMVAMIGVVVDHSHFRGDQATGEKEDGSSRHRYAAVK